MKVATTAIAKTVAILAVGALALTGCTYESEKLDRPVGGASAAPFDQNSVKLDPALAVQLPEQIKNRGTLIVGSNTEYPPAESLDSNGNATGYDIEMITAIAKKLGLKTEVQSAEFTGILPALGPKYDVGISSFTITQERLKNVNMVSFLNVGTTWAVQKGNPQNVDLNNICGLSIGVQTGYPGRPRPERPQRPMQSRRQSPHRCGHAEEPDRHHHPPDQWLDRGHDC